VINGGWEVSRPFPILGSMKWYPTGLNLLLSTEWYPKVTHTPDHQSRRSLRNVGLLLWVSTMPRFKLGYPLSY
jgi:hypothetical protein